MAKDKKSWTKYFTDLTGIWAYRYNKKHRLVLDPPQKPGDFENMIDTDYQCFYNFQCVSECCTEPRKKGHKGSVGRRGSRHRHLRRNYHPKPEGGFDEGLEYSDKRRMVPQHTEHHGGPEDDGALYCAPRHHCEDRKGDFYITIWYFCSALLIGILIIIAVF